MVFFSLLWSWYVLDKHWEALQIHLRRLICYDSKKLYESGESCFSFLYLWDDENSLKKFFLTHLSSWWKHFSCLLSHSSFMCYEDFLGGFAFFQILWYLLQNQAQSVYIFLKENYRLYRAYITFHRLKTRYWLSYVEILQILWVRYFGIKYFLQASPLISHIRHFQDKEGGWYQSVPLRYLRVLFLFREVFWALLKEDMISWYLFLKGYFKL